MNPINKPVIEVEDFSKNYWEFAAVRNLSFAVAPGEIVGLVGANGAGKTTTLRAITGILRPSAGTVRIVGFDIEREPVAAKQQFAYVPDTIHPYDLLTVTEHLHFIALAYRVADPEAKYNALLEELELADKKDAIASSLSRGMLQKLSLACAFLREPRVIILDEPLTGLDPRGIRNIKQSIRRRAAAGTAFLLSSHLLVLVEALCDKVFILHLKLKTNVFEISLASTTRTAERRRRVRQGHRTADVEGNAMCSARLPKLALFRGVGAIFWKNLVVARRSKRELILACAFTLIYTAFLAAIRWGLRDAMSKGGELPAGELADFDNGVMLLLASLAFLLQWACPFDFRRDGAHLVGFRTLPVSPFALVLAEIAVPTVCCLAFLALGIGLLMIYGRFDWPVLALMLFGYPAIALALNGVWNLRYLLAATKCASGRAPSASAVGTLMVVALSFLIFFPAGWTAVQIGDHFVVLGGKPDLAFAAGGFLAVQYLVDFLLVMMLAKMFQRFDVSRDS